MRKINFKVDKQRLSKVGNFEHIVKGTKGFLQCVFSFDEENNWKDYNIVAVFEAGNVECAVIVDNNTCIVPNEVTDLRCFKIRLIGIKESQRITTNKELIKQEE